MGKTIKENFCTQMMKADLPAERIIQGMCDWFEADELAKFARHLEEEGTGLEWGEGHEGGTPPGEEAPEEEDIFWCEDDGRILCCNKLVGVATSENEAVLVCIAYMKRQNYYPDCWKHTERGDFFRLEIPERDESKLHIKLTNADEGMVTCWCDDKAGALADQTIMGTRWEGPADMLGAYAEILDASDLVKALEAEGYEVDDSEYFPVDPGNVGQRAWDAASRWESSYGQDIESAELLTRLLDWDVVEHFSEGDPAFWMGELEGLIEQKFGLPTGGE